MSLLHRRRVAVLLFDVMGTLVTEPFYQRLPAFFGMSMKQLLAEKHPTSWVEFERGLIDEGEYLRRFFADERPVDQPAFKAMMWEGYEYMDGIEPLLAELHAAGQPMYALSNYPRWFELIDRKLGLSRYLRFDFVSCLTGHRKPDPKAYLCALDALKISGPEAIFIDDRPENLPPAEALGMQVILRAEPVESLRRDLAALGVQCAPCAAPRGP